jgi:hypothetical protein
MSNSTRALVAVLTGIFWGVAPAAAADDEKKDAPVSGKFTGNGKETKLAYASAQKDGSDKDRITLIFTEKDHSKVENPRFKAMFGDLGSALLITVNAEGKVFGCEVYHTGHKKPGFNDIGALKTTDFKIADGKITGGLTSEGEKETFGDKWEVKLKFEVKKP